MSGFMRIYPENDLSSQCMVANNHAGCTPALVPDPTGCEFLAVNEFGESPALIHRFDKRVERGQQRQIIII